MQSEKSKGEGEKHGGDLWHGGRGVALLLPADVDHRAVAARRNARCLRIQLWRAAAEKRTDEKKVKVHCCYPHPPATPSHRRPWVSYTVLSSRRLLVVSDLPQPNPHSTKRLIRFLLGREV
ncbi:hypothetical protein BHE74_00026640 [Ensete ventricosum]|nr:hypothetical protein BHE74_00026640 [Ensete ventricosum]